MLATGPVACQGASDDSEFGGSIFRHDGFGIFVDAFNDSDENVAALCGELKRVAVRREVLAAVSNKNILQMLTTFIEGTRRANITNTVIVALDEPTAEHVRKLGVATYVRQLRSRTGSTDNHATSGLKFAVLRDFVLAGCSVLLSDVDVVWLHNPFTLPSIYRTPRSALTRPLAACHA